MKNELQLETHDLIYYWKKIPEAHIDSHDVHEDDMELMNSLISFYSNDYVLYSLQDTSV